MKTYYRHGDTYFELDHENKIVANITVNDYNKCMVVSSGLNGPFSSTYEAFEANLTRNQLQGPQFVSSSFEGDCSSILIKSKFRIIKYII